MFAQKISHPGGIRTRIFTTVLLFICNKCEQKELNFSRLMLAHRRLLSGLTSTEEYLQSTRQSLKTLDELEKCKKLMLFNCG
jgi:hypothetical protein